VIVARQHRIGRDEIDIVAVDRRTVVFVEVKSRQSSGAGEPFESIDDRKRLRLSRAALRYLRRHDLLEVPSRFDVVSVTWPPGDKNPRLDHVTSAFAPISPDGMYS
jgi:putative endonuclease